MHETKIRVGWEAGHATIFVGLRCCDNDNSSLQIHVLSWTDCCDKGNNETCDQGIKITNTCIMKNRGQEKWIKQCYLLDVFIIILVTHICHQFAI